jgi:hypothetical protein
MLATSLLHFTMYCLKINIHACVRSDSFANFRHQTDVLQLVRFKAAGNLQKR